MLSERSWVDWVTLCCWTSELFSIGIWCSGCGKFWIKLAMMWVEVSGSEKLKCKGSWVQSKIENQLGVLQLEKMETRSKLKSTQTHYKANTTPPLSPYRHTKPTHMSILQSKAKDGARPEMLASATGLCHAEPARGQVFSVGREERWTVGGRLLGLGGSSPGWCCVSERQLALL